VKAETRPILVSALALLALAGCQDKKQAAPSKATAVGEVLPGSVSDEMLPVDTVRSQPPLAPKPEPGSGKSGKPHASDKPATDSPAEADPAAEPPADAPPAPPPAQ
jgi:hypothetical protein